MIFESEKERIAFKFICNYASEAMSNAGCNDLEQDMVETFKGETVPTTFMPENIVEMKEIVFDFDILAWLKSRIKQ